MNHTELAQKFFTEVIDGWMLGDLENMVTKIPPVKGRAGNCNFPIALYIFSCIEFLGFLTSNAIIADAEDCCTKKRIWSYINSYLDDNYISQLKPYENDFVNIFRHGLAHEFFAKAAGVSRGESLLVFYDAELKSLVLDADKFCEAFKSSTENLKKAISQNSDRIADKMLSRYNVLQASNIIKFLPKNIPTSTRTSSSNASIAEPIEKTTTTFPYDPEK